MKVLNTLHIQSKRPAKLVPAVSAQMQANHGTSGTPESVRIAVSLCP